MVTNSDSREPRARLPPSVAIVIPVYRDRLLPEEKLSLRHLERFLDNYDRYFIAPASLRPRRSGFEVKSFPDVYFKSVESYSRLLLSPFFYRSFSRYRFILIYQLDSLVFADNLIEWCETSFDYVGAPWLADPAAPEKGLSRVGNGGFSLRRVASCLRALESARYVDEPIPWLRDLLHADLPDLAPHRLLKRIRVLREVRRGARWYAGHYSLNEDHFWSDRAPIFYPGFRIAPVETALEFAFERAPRYCFARNGGRLPFGCHAWARWDRAFWEPYLTTEDPS